MNASCTRRQSRQPSYAHPPGSQSLQLDTAIDISPRNKASTKALSSLTRGREYEAFRPSRFNIASTAMTFMVAPLSP